VWGRMTQVPVSILNLGPDTIVVALKGRFGGRSARRLEPGPTNAIFMRERSGARAEIEEILGRWIVRPHGRYPALTSGARRRSILHETGDDGTTRPFSEAGPGRKTKPSGGERERFSTS